MAPADDDDAKRRQDISDVMREERARRRPIDLDAIRERLRLRRDYWTLLNSRDEKMFREFLTELGWSADSAEFQRFVRAWRALRK